MSRLSLAGYGDPIPTISLPDPNASGERPTLELVLEHGVPFEKEAYTSLGYTHYEVWCVGGAGGLGGGAGDISWDYDRFVDSAPLDVWNAWTYLEALQVPNVFVQGRWVPAVTPGFWEPQTWEPLVPAQWMTTQAYMDYANPTRKLNYWIWNPPIITADTRKGVGGAGGGGGAHVVFGLLEDLPDLVDVAIGGVGADGLPGQDVNPASFIPEPPGWADRNHRIAISDYWQGSTTWYSSPSEMALVTLVNSYMSRWPDPHISIGPPQPGQDGELSTFGEVGKASGGQGGGPVIIWDAGVKKLSGVGGYGGLGNREEAGGGGKGSSTNASGSDGLWEGGIGGGGGGGRGGGGAPNRLGTPGGRGSFSYLDTTVYGQRGYPYGMDVFQSGPGYGTTQKVNIGPGGGGGVRVNRKRPMGSKADGYSPDGMILIRLFKIDE